MDLFLHVFPPVLSVLVYLVPYQTITIISRIQSSGDFPALTFVSMAVMSAIWGTYGGLKNDSTILIPNLIGSGLSIYYLFVFESFTSKGARLSELYRFYQAGIVLLACVLFVVCFESQEAATSIVGTCGAVLGVVFAASPLTVLPIVMKNRTPESIPFPISLMMFLNGFLWCAYGFLVTKDRSVWFPNMVASVVSLFQLGIHAVFYCGWVPKSTGEGVKMASL